MKTKLWYLITVIVILSMTAGIAMADDSITFRRNISKTPEQESEKAGLAFMKFTVPAQASDGTLLEGIDYIADDESVTYTTTTAKPLLAVYIDDLPHDPLAPVTIKSGLSIGRHDTYIAHSLDDGATWKSTNVSRAADLSSFNLADGLAYPGDSYAAVQAVAGNKVMAAWLSRYCEGGSPLYTLVSELDDITAYAGELQTAYELPDLYVLDLWGVAGSQKSVDYTLQGFPEVGEIPFGCVWTARGTLMLDAETNTFDIVWTKAERLTSGMRDPNRLEVDAIEGAGFVVTWQEDPEGLRPGQGLGPGEGWSGAIVNAKTDIWYSYLDYDHFNLVDTDLDPVTVDVATPVELFVGDTQPKVAVPMSMPVRLTDNNMCKPTKSLLYCYFDFDVDFDVATGTLPTEPTTASDFCASTVDWETPQGVTLPICVTEDGRALNGRVGASRPRINLQAFASNIEGITDSAWFLTSYEETKALGEYLDEEEDVIEIGKNIWYHSFEFNKPEVVQQGGMLNQPSAYDPEHPELTVGASGFLEIPEDEFGYTVYMTEIARRASIMSQGIKALDPEKDGTYAGTTAYLLYKEGTLNQGGPADIMARRIVLPADFDPLVDNPYSFEYLACTNKIDTTDNPNYLQGLCADPATNLSGTTTDICYSEASVIGAVPSQDCVDDFPWDGSVEETFPKVSEWDQSVDNLDDQSWENPFDVSKGHRGFIDGNFVMIMYAWSPNWKANSVGNDKYNLYVRRSFDGGLTWTTTPADLGGTGISDSTVDPSLCENWGIGGDDIVPVCYTYGPGEFERARNVSQLTGTKITILDPRYTPAGGLKKWIVEPYKDLYLDTSAYTIEAYDTLRDPSKFFMIFETGDNTTAAEGEPTPLDLYYSRATVYGDIWDWDEVEVTDGTELRWFAVENKKDDLSGEAAMVANPSGDFMYTNWNQWKEDILEDGTELIFDSDIMFSRYFYNTFKDLLPATTIVYSGPTAYSTSLDETIMLIANLRDYDQMDGGEEVEYEWLIDGVEMAVDFNSSGSLDDDCYRTKQCNIPARNLSNGWHGFSVRGKDNDGNWSKYVTKDKVLVAEQLFFIRLPITIK